MGTCSSLAALEASHIIPPREQYQLSIFLGLPFYDYDSALLRKWFCGDGAKLLWFTPYLRYFLKFLARYRTPLPNPISLNFPSIAKSVFSDLAASVWPKPNIYSQTTVNAGGTALKLMQHREKNVARPAPVTFARGQKVFTRDLKLNSQHQKSATIPLFCGWQTDTD